MIAPSSDWHGHNRQKDLEEVCAEAGEKAEGRVGQRRQRRGLKKCSLSRAPWAALGTVLLKLSTSESQPQALC